MKNKRLTTARKEKGFTQEVLAILLGYKGKQSVANWENGYSSPPLSVAIRIGEILEKDVGFLFTKNVQKNHTIETKKQSA
ncbi:helix-turn-helix domain-containing protein [Chengkuizengella sp. SCS-71B]|uniref:helix-turn-helix domain-containing protein n=1 Tax=Chengkuizengella sp. SCS-71B TaxID=3115290 RepID=UPI0032C244CB